MGLWLGPKYWRGSKSREHAISSGSRTTFFLILQRDWGLDFSQFSQKGGR